MADTFHEGERALQVRDGSARRMAEVGPRVIRDHMPDQHREFFSLLPFLLVGSVDESGQPWASVLAGPEGFAHSPEPRLLRIDALPLPGDPLGGRLREGMPVGLLGIQPHTRRRNRMNGRVEALDAAGFSVRVGQSFGNCPKYIQPREAVYDAQAARPRAPEVLASLDATARELIASADTFFIATAHPGAVAGPDAPGEPAFGVDVSHRGGPAGFVALDGEGRLRVPDFVGNSFFNTLGNLQLEPRCGLLFIDTARGDVLMLSARAELRWHEAAPEGPATRRELHLAPTGALRLPAALPLRWRGPDAAAL